MPILLERAKPELPERACADAGILLTLRGSRDTITAIISFRLHGRPPSVSGAADGMIDWRTRRCESARPLAAGVLIGIERGWYLRTRSRVRVRGLYIFLLGLAGDWLAAGARTAAGADTRRIGGCLSRLCKL
jgi:hypothetical protein